MTMKKKLKAIILAAVCVLIIAAIALSAVLIYRSTPQFALNEAAKYIDMSDYKSAIIALEEALIKFPDNTDIRLSLSEAYELDGNVESAIRILEETPETDESDASEKLKYLRDTYIGNSVDDNIASLSEERLKSAVSDEPDNPEYRLSLAAKYAITGNTEAAKSLLEQAVNDFPDDHRFAIKLAEVIKDTESSQAAEEYLSTVVEKSEPKSDEIVLTLAEMYLQDGKNAEAFDTIELLENKDNISAAELIEKINISYANDIYSGNIAVTEDNAIQIYASIEKIIEDYPEKSEGHLALAKIYDIEKDVNAEYELLTNLPPSINDERITQELDCYNATSDEIQSMLYDYLNSGANLNRKILRNVTRLDIYGSYYIFVSCGENDDAERPVITDANRYNFTDEEGKKHDYGKLRTLGITRYMPKLSSLTVCYNTISDISALEGKNTLTYLDLAYNNTRNISPLSGLASLEELYLGYNIGTDDMELSNLSDVTTLKKLSLKGVSGFKGLKSIEALPNLEYLSLSYTKFSDTEMISGFARLKELYIYDTPITNVNGLTDLTSLEVLSIGGENIRDINALSSLRKLKKLNIDKSKINNISVLSNFTELESLNLCTQFKTEFNFSVISGMRNLKHLKINSAYINDLSGIETLSGLEHLELGYVRTPNASPLSSLKNLEYLNLNGSYIYDLAFIKNLTQMKELYMFNCVSLKYGDGYGKHISDLSPLSNLHKLEKLDVSYASISNFDALSGLINLKYLNLDGSFVDKTDLSFLSGLTKLSHLNLGNSMSLYHGYITDISYVSGLTNLEYLDLHHHGITDPSPLYSLKKLKSLDISWNYINESSLSSLKEALPKCNISLSFQKN